jgi:2-keto-4-pentenoate hydratase/2-oxohepta-3-ene-1,7-dioic acid hydratase in catechol pathway
MFPKLPNAVAGYGDQVQIPKLAQDNQADYEGELVIVIGKDAKNVLAKDAYDYVIGYTVANDMSARCNSLFQCVLIPIAWSF